MAVSVLEFDCFLVRSECEGSLTLREMSDRPSHQADLGAVCMYVCSVTTGHGLLVTKPHPILAMFAPLPTTQAHTVQLHTHTHTCTNTRPAHLLRILYIHTSHPSPVTHTHAHAHPPPPPPPHTHTACLVGHPAAPTRLAALLSLCSDRWVCEKHFLQAQGSLSRRLQNDTRNHTLMGLESCSETLSVCMCAGCNTQLIMLLWWVTVQPLYEETLMATCLIISTAEMDVNTRLCCACCMLSSL